MLVQTLAPDAAAIEAAARHDAAGFLAGELERRRALRYPPFSSLVRVELSTAGADGAERAAGAAHAALAGALPADAELLGPAPGFGCVAATGASFSSRPAIGRRPWPRSARRSRPSSRRARSAARSQASTSIPRAAAGPGAYPRLAGVSDHDPQHREDADGPVTPQGPSSDAGLDLDPERASAVARRWRRCATFGDPVLRSPAAR